MSLSYRFENKDGFTMGYYFQSLMGLLVRPGSFFEDLPDRGIFGKSLGYLFLSALFYWLASLTLVQERYLPLTGISFLNALAMPVITAWIAFMVMILFPGKRVKFSGLFSVFAFASGTTLLMAWIPSFIWITEPWKWILVFKGMVRGCGLRRLPAFLIIAVTIAVLFILFRSLVQDMPG